MKTRRDHKRGSKELQKSGSSRNFVRPFEKGPKRASLPEGIYVVEGLAALREYLRYKPNTVKKIFVKEHAYAGVRAELEASRIDVVKVGDNADDGGFGSPIWAHVKHDTLAWNDFMSELDGDKLGQHDFVVVLDHISDPRNLGAIIRSAAFFGIRRVIVPERRQVLLTQAGVNTAQGGFALTDLVVVVNVSRALDELKKKDFWVLGGAMAGEAVAGVRGRYKKQVLVLGSEDKGISQGVLSHCDVLVSIPGGPKALDSLNVSVAAGILMHELKSRGQ